MRPRRKGISRHPDGWLVRSMWRGRQLSRLVATLDEAFRLRRQFERKQGKPRTERWIRAAGQQGSVYWRRK